MIFSPIQIVIIMFCALCSKTYSFRKFTVGTFGSLSTQVSRLSESLELSAAKRKTKSESPLPANLLVSPASELPAPLNKLEYKFTVFTEPQAMQRPRLNPRVGRIYSPSTKDQEKFVTLCIPNLPSEPITTPIEAELNFYFERPKLHFRTGKFADQLKPDAPVYHSKKPGECLVDIWFLSFLFFCFHNVIFL
jgi:hypothetical protein